MWEYLRSHQSSRFIACMAVMVAAVFFAQTSGFCADGNYEIKQLRSPKHGADYIVVAPAAFIPDLKPLLDKRAADGFRVAVASTESVQRVFSRSATGAYNIRDFVRYAWHHWKAPAPKYLLLVGDTVATATYSPADITLPAFLVTTDSDPLTASDNPYADMDGDELPDLAVGRLPADNPEELRSMISKILAYETAPLPGEWRRRVSMFASEGHFGAAIDKMLEEMFKKLVGHNVSPNFDLNMTYANPNMAYFYIPTQFNDKVIDRFNDGSLFMVYIGHGLARGFDDVRVGKERYPIMVLKDVPSVDNGGRRQFLFIIACDTGKFHLAFDSIGEQLFKSPTGPVGVFASSEVSHPYSNALIAKDIAYYLMTERPQTIGDALVLIKRALVERFDPDRKLIDDKAKLMMNTRELEKVNRDHLFMYNYLGDPATRIAYPDDKATISAPETAAPGETIPLVVKLPSEGAAKISVTLECPATEVIYETKFTAGLKGAELNAAIKKNYENANNKVAARQEAMTGPDGAAKISLSVPGWLPAGEYFIKVYSTGSVRDSMGYSRIRIQAEK